MSFDHLNLLNFYFIFAFASLYSLHIVSLLYTVGLFSVSLRSWTTIQGDSPGIARTDPPRRPRSRSLCSQRRSSSSSRRNTLAGLSRRRNKARRNKKTLQPQWKRQGCVLWINVDFRTRLCPGSWFLFTCLNNGTRKLWGESVFVLWLQTRTVYSVFPAKSFTPKRVHSENTVLHYFIRQRFRTSQLKMTHN